MSDENPMEVNMVKFANLDDKVSVVDQQRSRVTRGLGQYLHGRPQ